MNRLLISTLALLISFNSFSSSDEDIRFLEIVDSEWQRSIDENPLYASYKYNPSGSPSVFVFKTRSLAALKSAIWTRILRSLNAIRPASEQIALISAPERSSFWLMNSSRSTSSFKDILDV